MNKPIVSPYLEEFDAQLFMPEILRKIPDSEVRRICEAQHKSQNAFLFYDYSQMAFFITSFAEWRMLRELWKKPLHFRFADKNENETFVNLSKRRLILEEESAFQFVIPHLAGIEINSHCNYRCGYCPVSQDPFPKAFMSPETYLAVLNRFRDAGIKSICLNHYGEPTLDPNLVERVRTAADFNFAVILFTNASCLSPSLSEELTKYRHLSIIANLPTTDPEKYYLITGQRCLPQVMANIQYARQIGLQISVQMNLPRNTPREQEALLRKEFSRNLGINLLLNKELCSRGGILQHSEYISRVKHAGKLNGCLRSIVANNEGKVFLCCHDYKQKYILGDIRISHLHEILANAYSIQLRKWIFGYEEPPEDFICRYCEETSSQSENIISVGRHKNPSQKMFEFYTSINSAEKGRILLDSSLSLKAPAVI
jgi:hypothetical protein